MVTTTTGRATDFITFSRTSNATVTDSNGLIKWAGHNLLTNSESFDAAAWTKSSATVTANSEAAPNNTTTGDTIAASGANGTVLQSYTALAVPYTFGVWLKRKTGTGTIEIAADNGTYTAVTITSSWALYTVTQTPAAGSKSAGIRIVSSGDEVYAWGAHLYRSDLGGMVLNPARGDAYYPTTPRNLLGFTESLNTGWAFFGSRIEGIGPELVSNGDFSSGTTTGWTGFNSTLSVVSGALRFTVSTDGQAGAYTEITTVPGKTYRLSATFVADAANGNTFLSVGTTTTGAQLLALNPASIVGQYSGVFVATGTTAYISVITSSTATTGQTNDWDNFSVKEVDVYQSPNGLTTARAVEATTANGTLLGSLSLLASPYTFSIWLKRKTGTGTVEITVDGTTYVTAAVTSDWQRFSTTLTPSAGTRTPGIRLVTSGDAVYAWGAQLSDSASLDAYSPVYGAAVTSAAYYAPRLDFDPVTLAALGLLVEEQRTNVVLYNRDLTNAAWTASDITPLKNVIGIDGAANSASRITATNANGTILQSITLASSARFQSAYVKRITGTGTIEMTMDNGSTWTAITATNDWTRVSIPSQTLANPVVGFRIVTSGDAIAVDMVQNENGAFATSTIPTLAATATRTADDASVSTQAFPYSATEGTLVVNYSIGFLPDANFYGRIASLSTSVTNLTDLFINGGFGPRTAALMASNGVSQFDTTLTPNLGATTTEKVAIAYQVGNTGLVKAGGTVNALTVTALPTNIPQLMIANSPEGRRLNGHIRQITYLPRRISNTELQARTV